MKCKIMKIKLQSRLFWAINMNFGLELIKIEQRMEVRITI